MNLNKFLSIVQNLQYIRRFNIRPVVHPQTVAEHSHIVSLLAIDIGSRVNDILASMPSKDFANSGCERLYNLGDLALKSVMHDVPEALTSDLIYFIKHYDAGMEQKLKKIEKEAIDQMLGGRSPKINGTDLAWIIMNAKDNTPEGELVAICDILEGYIYLSNESCSGNRHEWLAVAQNDMHQCIVEMSSKLPHVTEMVLMDVLQHFNRKNKGQYVDGSDFIGGNYAKKPV